MASAVRVGSKPSSAAISLSIRPSTPPASLVRLKAASIPSFIWRPSSFEEPENGPAIPNRISRSDTPRTGGTATAATGALGAVAAEVAKDGAIAAAKLGPGPAIDRSRSPSWRSATLQSILPDVTAPRPSATLRSSNCVRSERSASLDEASVITAVNLSTMTWMRGRAMSRQADAEPTIGPTRPARSRTTSVLSPAAAPAVPVSSAPNKNIVKRAVIAKPPRGQSAKLLLSISSCDFFLKSKRIRRRYGDRPFWATAPISFKFNGLVLPVFIDRRSPDLVRSLVFGAAKTKRDSKAHIEIMHVLQDVDEFFGIELRPRALERLDQDIGRNETFERHVVGRLAGKIFGQSILVFEDHARITGYRRHHLGHDGAAGIARSQQHQFIGKGGAAHERHIGVDHPGKEVVRLFDELGGGPIRSHHDDRFDRRLLQFQLIDRVVHIHGVALVVEPHNRAVTDAERAHGLCDPGEARIPVGILLGENGDLVGWYPAHFHQIAHGGIGLFRVARTVVEYIAIGRIVAEHIGAGESAEEQHPPFQRIGDGDHRGGRSDISDDAEDLVFVVELLHGIAGAGRLITVISRDQLKHPAFHAAGLVDPVEGRIDPELHLAPKFLGRAGKRRRHSEPDLLFGYAAVRGADGDRCDRCGRCQSGGGGRWCNNSRQTIWRGPGDGAFDISELALRQPAIHPARCHGVTTVSDTAFE